MALLRNRRGVTGMLFLVAITGWAAAQPDKPATGKDKTEVRGQDVLKSLPPGAIIVICDDLKTAKQLSPKLILLTPKQYQDMRDEIARHKAGQPEENLPGECRLTGKVDGDVVRLQAEFRFKTENDGEHVLLACRLGQPTSATLDDGVPILRPTARGLVARVEKQGDHVAKLELEINLVAKGDRGSERGFDLDLPGAAMTRLELMVPGDVKEAALGVSGPARTWSGTVQARKEGTANRLVQHLGPATSLEVSWKGPIPVASGPASLTAQAAITIRIDPQRINTEAEWTLTPRGRPVAEWKLHVPLNAQVAVKEQGQEDRLAARIETPAGTDRTLRVLKLKEPTLDPIQLVVQLKQERGHGPVPIGPFAVEGAARQRGEVLIGAPADARLRVVPRAALSPREVTADEARKDIKAAFSYWLLAPLHPPADQTWPPLLAIDVDANAGTFEARVEHELQRTAETWRLKSMFRITPPVAGMDLLSVKLPADFSLRRDATRTEEPNYTIQPEKNPGVAELKFTQRQTKEFRLTLEGDYPASPQGQGGQASLRLPRLPGAAGQGPHRITVQLPDTMELELPRESNPTGEIERTRYNRQTWKSDRQPERIDLAWQPHRQEILLASVADVLLKEGMGEITQRIWFASALAPVEMRLRVPEAITDLAVLDRGEWDPKARTVSMAREATKNQPLRLRYSFPIRPSQRAGRTFPVPLLVPPPDARCATTLRVACEAAALVERAGGPWQEARLEPLADGKRLAALVLTGDHPESPPTLRQGEAAALPAFGLERALLRARVGEQGQQSYHASFLIHSAGARQLDVELPGPPATLGFRAALDGIPAAWGLINDKTPRPADDDPARIARVPLGMDPVGHLVRLDVWYQISPGQLAASPGRAWIRLIGPVQTVLHPPRLCGQAGRGPVRWQVVLPADWVPIGEDSALPVDLAWAWRGWLVGTRPSASAGDLERWIAGTGDRPPDSSDVPIASVVVWRTGLDPLILDHAPQRLWLLGCSVGLLGLALGLHWLRGYRVLFWGLVLGALAGASAVGLLGSSTFWAVVYGCEPGLVVVFVIVVLQWLLHQRYRRQVVFLPSFKRVRVGGSSLIHKGENARPREPSTVDAIPPAASNQWATGAPASPSSGRAEPAGSSQTKRPPA